MNSGFIGLKQMAWWVAGAMLCLPVLGNAAAPAAVQPDQAPPAVAWPVMPDSVKQRIDQAVAETAQTHPNWHTRWLNAQGQPWFSNRLALSSSPYLLEHAHNPVNWYPFDDEALATAKAQNKLLFISIGYASCHWCHVMARESFESPAVARFLNEHFIAVKVDRQQQPALDARYQLAVALLNQGRTGWPANIFALPDGRPIAAHLYEPETALQDTLKRVETAWRTEPERLRLAATQLTAVMQRALDQQAKAATLDTALMHRTVTALMAAMDPFSGGFGDGVKFPEVSRLLFLLDQLATGRLPDAQAQSLRALLTQTLSHMDRGGLQDQIGGGFFRYSTTPDWQEPHFEKMAYDQAMLSLLYLRAALVFSSARDAQVARRTLDFVLREFTVADGGFAAALSAESLPDHQAGTRPQEGVYYQWNKHRLDAVLSPSDAALARSYWQLDSAHSLPHRLDEASLAALAAEQGKTLPALQAKLSEIQQKLLMARAERPAPRRDDDRILAWNALLIEALATAGRQLDEPRFTAAAQAATQFIDTHMRLPDGTLAHAYNQKRASGRADLADLADYGRALLALYDTTGQADWLDQAKQVATQMNTQFAAPDGGFYDRPAAEGATGGVLALPLRPFIDDQEPAGNTAALRFWQGLAARTPMSQAPETIDHLLAGFSGLVARNPLEATGFLAAVAQASAAGVSDLHYLAEGAVRVQAVRRGANSAQLILHFAPGWHSNAQAASESDADAALIPTTVSLLSPAKDAAVDYPPGVRKVLSFSDKPLNLYENTVMIDLRFSAPAHEATRIGLKLQTCSASFCRLPEFLVLWLPPVVTQPQ